ncbi:nuclear transport factor 2 family protein [Sphingomonas sp. YL-JM2C]
MSNDVAMSEQARANLAKVNRAYAAIATNDVENFVKEFDEYAILSPECLPYGGPFEGKEGLIRGMYATVDAWDDRSMEIETMLANDEMVVAVATFIGTGKPTGMHVRFPFHAVWRFRDGKLVSLQPIYGDTALVLEALKGYVPPKR